MKILPCFKYKFGLVLVSEQTWKTSSKISQNLRKTLNIKVKDMKSGSFYTINKAQLSINIRTHFTIRNYYQVLYS